MADNKTKIDRLHDLMPKGYNTKHNPNWKALLGAVGDVDQQLADLITEVRQQFFIKTASRPYLDRLGANNKVARPKLVGMDDVSYRQYIPVLSYKPKQVKLIIDALLDIFFFKESTTAFITSQEVEPFVLKDGWELSYLVDEIYQEQIIFKSGDFTDINNVTADELVASINRQAQYSYATANYDSITKKTSVRIFTNTIGSKGSLRVAGGRANVSFRWNGFIDAAGNGTNTQWTVTKIGDTVTFAHTGGTSPAINNLRTGDKVIINLAGNEGSFVINKVDIFNDSIEFTNLFATVGVFAQIDATQVKFIRPNKYAAYLNNKRAMAWETAPGEIEVEMPTSPPVVKRSLKGSAHINGTFSLMQSRNSDTVLTLDDASKFSDSGSFFIEPVNEIDLRYKTISENTITSNKTNGRLQYDLQKYTYTTKIGNTLNGISPALPNTSSLNEQALVSLQRDAFNTGIAFTPTAHGYKVGEYIIISDSAGAVDSLNGTWKITGVPSTTVVEFFSYGQNTVGNIATPGTGRVERLALANSGSKIILTNSISNSITRITGSYIWDTASPFVLSAATADIQASIQAGKIVRILEIGPNSIPDKDGFVIFDYGLNTQEGPVRYLYKPTATTLAIDPSYLFKFGHSVGSAVTAISHKGPHAMSGIASEYGPYITDPSEARIILQELIKTVKSAGIFVNFIIRFPEQIYGTLDVYQSGVTPQ